MSRELLLSRVGDHLNVTGQERELAANTLLQWVVARLKSDQSIQISGIGAFQLKKEPLPREDRKAIVKNGPINKRTLVYAPVQDEMSKNVNSAFVSFDLDELKIDSNDYFDKVFSLNIDKPLIPIQGSSPSGFDSKVLSDEHQETLEEKIAKMVNEGEVLQDYNIFENYLLSEDTGKTTDEIEEDDLVKEELLKSIGNDTEEEIPGPQDTSEVIAGERYSIPGVPDKEEESVDVNREPEDEQLEAEDVDEHIDESLEESDIAEKIEDNTETGEQEITIVGSELESEDEELFDEITDSNISEENAPDEVESNKEALFAKLESYLKEDGSEEEEPDSGLGNEEDIVEELRLNEIEVEEKPLRNKPIRDESFFAKPGFIVTVTSIVVLAIFTFVLWGGDIFEDEASSSTNEGVTGTQTDQDQTRDVEQTEDSLNIANVGIAEQEDTVERTGLYRDIPNEVQTANQIFFDGSLYTVQVSSWKSKTIAENQVERLRSKNFDAFIFKKYVEGKKSTWHRVRIGYFTSLEDAKDFIIKNKF